MNVFASRIFSVPKRLRRLPWSGRVPPRLGFVVVAGVSSSLLILGWWFKLREPIRGMTDSERQAAEAELREQQLTWLPGRFQGPSSVPGRRFPELSVAGWLNGQPEAAALHNKVWVVHIWDDM